MREIADGCLIRGCVAEAYSVCFTINAGEVVSYLTETFPVNKIKRL